MQQIRIIVNLLSLRFEMKIYFIRHGEGEHNHANIAGPKNAKLTGAGIEQAKRAAKKLADSKHEFNRLLTSNLPRATATAEIISQHLKVPVHTTSLLNEIDYGEFAYKDYAKFNNATGEQLVNAGVETPESVLKRAGQLLRELEGRSESTLIVGHELFMRHLLWKFSENNEEYSSWKDVQRLDNCKLYVFQVNLNTQAGNG